MASTAPSPFVVPHKWYRCLANLHWELAADHEMKKAHHGGTNALRDAVSAMGFEVQVATFDREQMDIVSLLKGEFEAVCDTDHLRLRHNFQVRTGARGIEVLALVVLSALRGDRWEPLAEDGRRFHSPVEVGMQPGPRSFFREAVLQPFRTQGLLDPQKLFPAQRVQAIAGALGR